MKNDRRMQALASLSFSSPPKKKEDAEKEGWKEIPAERVRPPAPPRIPVLDDMLDMYNDVKREFKDDDEKDGKSGPSRGPSSYRGWTG